MNYLPLFIDLRGRRVLVVGGGVVAARKITLLLEAGAAVVVVARDTGAEIDAWIAAGRVTRGAATFDPAQLDDAWFVIAATDDRALNAAVAAAAGARRVPANVVDDLELSTAILPAIIDRSPVQIAVSTGGASPVFARYLRERLESLLDESTGVLAAFLERWRRRLREQGMTPRERRGLQSWMLQGPVAALVRAGRLDEAEATVERAVAAAGTAPPSGRVTLVGAGPGDPGLLTLNGLRALQEADVVLHDRLAAPQILALARREADLVDVGKLPGRHGTTQDQIHALLIEHARAGRHVVRLKGGDPFIFGRGGEELEVLRAAGIPYEVVPAVTAALGCAAYAGIPLTHRGHAQALTLVTAHSQDAAERVDWARLAAPGQTLAIYMGVGELERTTSRLMACSLSPATPAALVESGTRPEQRVISGPLADIAARARAAAIVSPALLIVGEVAAYAERLHWFGVTPAPQAGAED